MNADLLFQLQDVTAAYSKQPVLENINFSMTSGAFVALLGPNGSGKTTLLKTIAGILPPNRGRIMWNGDIRLGYVPQRDALDPIFLLSSLEVVQMVASGQKQWALECMQSTGAGDLARKQFSHLSGGQKQRVLIARALAARPRLLLLDEPTAGIDPPAAAAIVELLAKIHASGLGILMVTHDLSLMRTHAQRVVWVHHGRVTEGSAFEMLTRERILKIFDLDLG